MRDKDNVIPDVSTGIIKNSGRLLTYLTPVFYFLMAIMFYLRTYDSAQIKITITQMGGVIILAFFIIKVIEENSWKYFLDKNIFTFPLIVFFVSATVSLLRSYFFWASGHDYIRRIAYFTLAIVILKEFNDQKKIRRLLGWVIAAAYVSAIYGLIQFLDYHFFPPNPEPGLDPFIWRNAFGYRVFSTFGNPNFYGDFLAVVNPIALALFFRTKKYHYLILWFLITFNAYVTYSKGAWIGYAAGITFFAMIGMKYFLHKDPRIKKIVLWTMGVVIVSVMLGVGILSRQRTDSIKFRVYTWLSCWEMINTKPILGTGIGSFYVTYPAYRRPQIFSIEGKHNTESDHPENEFLEIWYDEGTVGFGIFLWLISVFVIGGMKALKLFSNIDERSRQPDIRAYYMWGLLSALGGMLVHNSVCVSLRFVSSGVMLWFLVGLIGSLVVNNPLPNEVRYFNPNKPKNPFPKIARRILQLLILIVMVWALKIYRGMFLADVHHNIAIFFSKQGQWVNALDNYNIVAKNNWGFIMAHYFMGNVYNDRWQEGDPDRALNKYRDVWRLAPNYVQSHHQAGLIYLKWGEDEKRLGDAARSRGDIAAATLHEERMRDKWQKAIKQFEEYHAIDPIFAQNYYRLAWVYIQLGEPHHAEETYLRHLYTRDALFKAGFDEREWVSEKMGRPATSIPDWCEIHKGIHHSFYWEDWGVRRSHEHSETATHLGNMKFMQNDLKKAEEYYSMAVEYDAANTHALKNLAIVLSQLGKQQESFEIWNKLREKNPSDPEVKRVFGLP